jgi:SPP1 gp7 family putative phage head morphogenesis protein
VNDTTRARLKQELDESAAAGEGHAELVARIDDVFDDAHESRAPLIARTETTPAYNFASEEAWKQSGVVEGKEWLSAQDDRVRDEHVLLDGTVVALDDWFEVGGDRAQYPGGFSSVHLNANCRCTLIPVMVPIGNDSETESLADKIMARRNGALNGHGGGTQHPVCGDRVSSDPDTPAPCLNGRGSTAEWLAGKS